jgi:disulfide bond formation protein DsbB
MSPSALLAPSRWPWIAGLYAAGMLAAAHAFERLGGYQPCTLCLRQREVYWVVLAGVLVWAVLATLRPKLRGGRLAAGLLAAAFLFSAGLAAYHAGVEWKWWPGPSGCSGAGGPVSGASLAATLSGEKPVRAPACDEAAWVFAGLSMAGWNSLASLAMAGLSVLAARGSRRLRFAHA